LKVVAPLRSEDEPKWDSFVHRHPCGSIYHLSGWARTLEAAFPHMRSRILTVVDNQTSAITAGLPICISRNLTGKSKLCSIPFAMQGDALSSSEEDQEILYNEMLGICQQENISKIEIRNLHSQPYLEKIGFDRSDSYIHHYLPLDRHPELLKSSFHKKGVQVSIRKALSNKIELKKGNTIDDLNGFYGILYTSRRRTGLPQIPLSFFTSLLEYFGLNNQLEILTANFEGIAIGAALLLKFKDYCVIEYGCDLLPFRNLCTGHFLDWCALNLAYMEGFKVLSFGRTSENNSGLMAYKNRWGTKTQRLYVYSYPNGDVHRVNSREKSSFYKFTRTILQKCPSWLYGNFSKIIYRQIQ
jgi:hypothetical protein